jgi:hypothetical protein
MPAACQFGEKEGKNKTVGIGNKMSHRPIAPPARLSNGGSSEAPRSAQAPHIAQLFERGRLQCPRDPDHGCAVGFVRSACGSFKPFRRLQCPLLAVLPSRLPAHSSPSLVSALSRRQAPRPKRRKPRPLRPTPLRYPSYEPYLIHPVYRYDTWYDDSGRPVFLERMEEPRFGRKLTKSPDK